MSFQVPEKFRVVRGHPLASDATYGNNGAFFIPNPLTVTKSRLFCIASDGGGWEHVSVTTTVPRLPTWDEMCLVRSIFWTPDECVLQFHPASADYVNQHERCLHLWRPIGIGFPIPPTWMIGDKLKGGAA